MKKAVYQLEPFTCPSCVKTIEQALKRTEGVEVVKVLFNSGKVRTEFDSAKVNETDLSNVLEKLGYPVLKTKVS